MPFSQYKIPYQKRTHRKLSCFIQNDETYFFTKSIGEGMEGSVNLFLPEKKDKSEKKYAVKYPNFSGMPSSFYDSELKQWNAIHPESPAFTADHCPRFIMPFLGEKPLLEEMRIIIKSENSMMNILLLLIAVAEEISRINRLGIHHEDIHEMNLMIEKNKENYKAYCIDVSTAVFEKKATNEIDFYKKIVKHSIWNNHPGIIETILLWEKKYNFSKCNFATMIAIIKLELAKQFLSDQQFNKADKLLISLEESDDKTGYPKKFQIDLNLLNFKLKLEGLSQKKLDPSLSIIKIEDILLEVKKYDKQNKRTETINDLLRLVNKARNMELKVIPAEYLDEILLERNNRSSLFRLKSYYPKMNLFKPSVAIIESKLTPTEKVLYHIGKKVISI